MQIHELAIPKTSLTPAEISDLIDAEKIGEVVARNIALAEQSSPVVEGRGVFQYDDYSSLFSLTGSMRVPSLETLGPLGQKFFTSKADRFLLKQGENGYYLRGLRHIVAVDPNMSLPQKLDQLRDDYVDGIQVLSEAGVLPERQHYELAPILDYIKTVAVTTFNGLVYGEKRGVLRIDDEDYQDKRRKLADYTSKTVRAYYLSLLDSMTSYDLDAVLDTEGQQVLLSTIDELVGDFRNYTFSSEYIVRPESTHPLTILGTTYLAVQRYPDTETVVGLPAGSTELACAIAQGYDFLGNRQVNLALLPFSLHSLKHEGGISDSLTDLVENHRADFTGKNVLLVDDNTSTGKTLQRVSTVIQHVHPQQLSWVVSEADIIRSQIDRNHTGRSHIANPVIYDSSIGILPVSRLLKPKRDLKELMEQRQLAQHYLKKAKEASDIKDKIKYEVFAEGLLHPIRYVLESTIEEDRIDSFEDTWLSNFHPITVEHDGKTYPTVEHAYQAAKFTSSDLTQLSAEQRAQVDGLLQERGYDPASIDLATIFTNTDVSPGTIKLLAGILQKFHFVPPEWDSQRVDVMIALLVQKYQDPELAKKLIATGDKVLIEGNTWNDTFWGVSNNRGRNILGGILMNIRDKIKSGSLTSTKDVV